jgi:copine 5/8/9
MEISRKNRTNKVKFIIQLLSDNLNPKFVTSFQVDYYFEIEQKIKFLVVDIDDSNQFEELGICETTLAKIINSGGEPFKGDLYRHKEKTKSQIIISSGYVDTNVNDYVL